MEAVDPTEQLRRRALYGFFMVAGVTLVGSSGYFVVGDGRWSVYDCVYMTVITLSTVGYGEVLGDMSAVEGARTWTLLIILGGSGTLVFFVSSLTAYIIEGDVGGTLRRRSMQKQIDRLHDHIIVIGAGATGIHVIAELSVTRRPFVVVDTSAARLERAHKQYPDILYLQGDGTDDTVLKLAGIERASGLAATLANDRDNLFVTISARALNGALRIVTKVIEDSASSKMRRAGANATVSPSHIGGMRLTSELVRPNVVEFLDQMLRDDETLRVEEVRIPDGSSLVGCPLGETDIRTNTSALVLAVRETGSGQFYYNPGPSFVLRAGMTLMVLSHREDLERLQRGIERGTIGRA